MMRYSQIGGDFEIAVQDLLNPTKQWFEDSFSVYTDTGRSAIYLALQAILEAGGSKKAWLPKYVCPSVVQPFVQLGFQINFYSMDRHLCNSFNLPIGIKNETFFYVHYFGKKNNEIIKWIKNYNIDEKNFIIEDCVQASLNENVGMNGDFSIRSFRKFLPQPDGAILTYKKFFHYRLEEADESFISQKFLGKLLKVDNKAEDEYLTFFAESESKLNQVIIPRKYSWLSKILYSKSNLDLVKKKRRENWFYLQKKLRNMELESKNFQSLYCELLPEEVPLGYPTFINGGLRDALREYLKKKQIFCPIHWQIFIGEENKWAEEKILSASIMTLPIDQRLNASMINRMAEEIKNFLEE